ncbi:MAG: hypothetical protein UT09_C0017G0012 [Parcubacteria group bacterium GW2011_GWF2_38_8]|nr:MAG: hypothetical protein UT09_C0017G0012 [Parcubacteria group bacterium GW2011_GWF2_38_8]
MDGNKKLEWSALEYEENIVVAGSVASFIYGNLFFGLLLIVGGILLTIFSIKKPDTVFYELNEKGLKIRNRLYPYENIKSFWVRREGNNPMLFIKSERFFMPVISMPIDQNYAEEIRGLMLSSNVPEEEMKEHPSEKIMDSLGF